MGAKFSSPLSGCFGHPGKSKKRAKTSDADDVAAEPPINKSLVELQQELAADSAALALLKAEAPRLAKQYDELRRKHSELIARAEPVNKLHLVQDQIKNLEKRCFEVSGVGSKLLKEVKRKQAQINAYASSLAATKSQPLVKDVSGSPANSLSPASTKTQPEVAKEQQAEPCVDTDADILCAKVAAKAQDMCDSATESDNTEAISTAVDVTVVPNTVPNAGAYAERLAALKQARLGARRAMFAAKQAATQPTQAGETGPAEPLAPSTPEEAPRTAVASSPTCAIADASPEAASLALPSVRDYDRRARLQLLAQRRQSKLVAAATAAAPQPEMADETSAAAAPAAGCTASAQHDARMARLVRLKQRRRSLKAAYSTTVTAGTPAPAQPAAAEPAGTSEVDDARQAAAAAAGQETPAGAAAAAADAGNSTDVEQPVAATAASCATDTALAAAAPAVAAVGSATHQQPDATPAKRKRNRRRGKGKSTKINTAHKDDTAADAEPLQADQPAEPAAQPEQAPAQADCNGQDTASSTKPAFNPHAAEFFMPGQPTATPAATPAPAPAAAAPAAEPEQGVDPWAAGIAASGSSQEAAAAGTAAQPEPAAATETEQQPELVRSRRVYTRDTLVGLAQCYGRPVELSVCSVEQDWVLATPRSFGIGAPVATSRKEEGGKKGQAKGMQQAQEQLAQQPQQPQPQQLPAWRRQPAAAGPSAAPAAGYSFQQHHAVAAPRSNYGAQSWHSGKGAWGTKPQPAHNRPHAGHNTHGNRQGEGKPGARYARAPVKGCANPRPECSVMHKTEDRYVPGQARVCEGYKGEKAMVGALNKLTPDNKDRILVKVVEVLRSGDVRTLQGFVDTFVDKAVRETHFSAMYAQWVQDVRRHKDCPQFPSEQLGDKPVDLRRLLLSKCQDSFTQSLEALTETSEALSKADSAAKDTQTEAASQQDLVQAQAAEKTARGCMLGTVQFIGNLFNVQLVSHSITRECLSTLVPAKLRPSSGLLECLCALLATAGKHLDTPKQPVSQAAVQSVCNKLESLSENTQYDLRTRCMLKDVLDLRHRDWQPRMEKAGPKKTSEIQAQAHAELNPEEHRGWINNNQQQPYSNQQHAGNASNSHGHVQRFPQHMSGGLSATGSGRSGQPAAAGATVPAASADSQPQQPAARGNKAYNWQAALPNMLPREDTPGPTPKQPAFGPTHKQPGHAAQAEAAALGAPAQTTTEPLTQEALRRKVEASVAEFVANGYKLTDMLADFAHLRQQGADMGTVTQLVVCTALEQRGQDVSMRLQPFEQVFSAALARDAGEGGMTPQEFEAGVLALMRGLHVCAEDMPKAPATLGHFLAVYVASGQVSLGPVLNEVLSVPPMEDEEDPPLVVAGGASDLVFALMKRLVEDAGQEKAAEQWSGSGLALSAFFDSFTREEPEQIAKQAEKAGLAFLAL